MADSGFKLASAYVQLDAKGTGEVATALTSIKSQFSSVALAATGLGGIFTAGALGLGLRSCIGQFAEAEQYGARLDAVLRATQEAAGFSGAQIRELTADLQKITRFEDDSTNAAAAMLLTFKEIKGPIFKDALQSAMDLSTVMGQDLKSSIMQIGKALQDPEHGMLALRRAGVSFNESQQELIKSLQASGNLLEAQKMILAELHSEFGGAAQADAETMAGKIDQMKNAWGDLAETLGGKVAPALKLVAEGMANAARGTPYGGPEAGNPQDTDKAINSRRLSAIREQMKKLNEEEFGIENQRIGRFGPHGAITLSAEEKERLKQIAIERRNLAQEAEKLGPKEFEKREIAGRIFRDTKGEKHKLTDAERKAQSTALGALGHPGKEKAEHHAGKSLFGYYEKIAKKQESIRKEGEQIAKDAMTAEEHLADKISHIRDVEAKGGLDHEQAAKAIEHAKSEFTERAMKDSDHPAKSARFGITELNRNIQQGILDSTAKKLHDAEAKKIADAQTQKIIERWDKGLRVIEIPAPKFGP